MDITRHVKWLKIPVFLLCLGPTALLTWKFFTDRLGANPLEVLQHSTGNWALIFLCITLAITPFRRLLHQNWLIRFRRMVGLFAFWYGCLHLLTYIVFDQFFDFSAMLHDVVKRPFITAGMTAFLLMVPLAMTSTSGWVRRMGGKRWALLHRLIYASAMAGVIHYYWLVKKRRHHAGAFCRGGGDAARLPDGALSDGTQAASRREESRRKAARDLFLDD